jgi:hypothetical protein
MNKNFKWRFGAFIAIEIILQCLGRTDGSTETYRTNKFFVCKDCAFASFESEENIARGCNNE